jgi:membrane-bound lytic murein transglycosylase B
MKKLLLLSVGLAVIMNIIQFLGSNQQRADAFTVPVSTARPAASPQPVRASSPLPASATSPATASTLPAATAPASAGPVAATTARLAAAGLRPDYAALYLDVQAKTGTPWQLLAAVHKIETGQRGTTTVTSYAGAQGPMQFMPGTFRAYAMDGDGDGAKNITDLEDAMLTAGRYLAAGGADKGNYPKALYNYNHSNTYVANVIAVAHKLGL